ncbi:MAG: biotin carboxylase, partial [Bacteroidota bacterium]
CEHEAFTSGHFDTHFVKDFYSPEYLKAQQDEEKTVAALLGLKVYLEQTAQLQVPQVAKSEWTNR